MPHGCRSSIGPDGGGFGDSIESLEAFARNHCPGSYVVNEHSLDPSAGTTVSARAWGKVIPHPDGQIVLDAISWQE